MKFTRRTSTRTAIARSNKHSTATPTKPWSRLPARTGHHREYVIRGDVVRFGGTTATVLKTREGTPGYESRRRHGFRNAARPRMALVEIGGSRRRIWVTADRCRRVIKT